VYYSQLQFKKNEHFTSRYTKKGNELITEKITRDRLEFPGGKSVCKLFLKVDKILYKEIYNKEGNQVKVN
jgi:hypothetical protein